MTEPTVKATLNLWDDYAEGGPTHAYVEGPSNLDDEQQQILLASLQARLDGWAFAHELPVKTTVALFDSRQKCPTLEEPPHFRRWQMDIEGLSHVARERFVEHVQQVSLEAADYKVELISES